MEFRTLGKTGLQVSVLGLGTEHLEQNQETMEDVIRTAVEAGVNYVDLLYPDREGATAFWDNVAPLLRTCREDLVLAAHIGRGPGRGGDLDGAQRWLDQILARVGNRYAEVVIVATIDTEEQWNQWGRPAAERLMRYGEEGRIGHIGMSGHFAGTALKAVHSGLLDVLMYGINLVHHDNATTAALLDACWERDVGVVAMKPFWGGALLCYNGRPTSITPVQCLAYTLSRPVATTVAGVKNGDELRAARRYLEASEQERDWRSAIPLMHRGLAGHCVRCGHCLPCPADVDIGETILLVGLSTWDGVNDWLRSQYGKLPTRASACIECGVCTERCLFAVDVIAKMHRAVELYESGAAAAASPA